MFYPPASGAVAWISRAFGRALIGAISGLVVVSLTLAIASSYFGLFEFDGPDTRGRSFLIMLGLGTALFASVAVVSGSREIKGKAGAVIKGTLTGTAIGVVAGAALGSLIGSVPENGIPQKATIALGVFLGGTLGTIVGGIIGAEASRHQKAAPPAASVPSPPNYSSSPSNTSANTPSAGTSPPTAEEPGAPASQLPS